MKYIFMTTTGVLLLVLGVAIVILQLTSAEKSVVSSIAGGGSPIAMGAMLIGVSQMLKRKNATTELSDMPKYKK